MGDIAERFLNATDRAGCGWLRGEVPTDTIRDALTGMTYLPEADPDDLLDAALMNHARATGMPISEAVIDLAERFHQSAARVRAAQRAARDARLEQAGR